MNLRMYLTGILTAAMIGFVSIANAEITVVNADLRKDLMTADTSSYLLTPNTNNVFENDKLIVSLEDVPLNSFVSWSKGSARKQFLEAHEDSVVHFWQAALDGVVWWLTPTAASCHFTNKTNEKITIDLMRSKISVGGYYGTPFMGNGRVLVLDSKQSIYFSLFRNDPIFVKSAPGKFIEVFPSDLSLSKNVLGNGDFQFAVSYGDAGNTEIINMHFDARLNRTVMSRYIKNVISK